MKKFLIFIILLTLVSSLYSQSLRVYDVDPSNYPMMKAKIIAFDAAGNLMTNLTPDDFSLVENLKEREIISVTCPTQPAPRAISVGVSFDVSGSMQMNYGGVYPIILAKDNALRLLEIIGPANWEMAIHTSDHRPLLLQDFSTNKILLNNIIQNIAIVGGGNDFVEQLYNTNNGILRITKDGKYKKIAILHTDGIWEKMKKAEEDEIINYCLQNNITLYTIVYTPGSLGKDGIKASLERISKETGGFIIHDVMQRDKAINLASEIRHFAQGGLPCEIHWLATPTCIEGAIFSKFKLFANNTEFDLHYEVKDALVAGMHFTPFQVDFGIKQPGSTYDTTISVRAFNSDFVVTNITTRNPQFDIFPKSFSLKSGESRNLTVTYTPTDTLFRIEQFEFTNDNCLITYLAFAGNRAGPRPTELTVIFPNGKEELIAGSDTLIIWDGVLPTDTVTIEYSIDNGLTWTLITRVGAGLKHKWNVPKRASKNCLARVTLNTTDTLLNLNLEMVHIQAGTYTRGNTGGYSGQLDESPTHQVTITNDFYIGKYEITQEQFQAVMYRNPSFHRGDSLPVEQVTWHDAIVFCNALSRFEGLQQVYRQSEDGQILFNTSANGYRLPTEAEWEFAARGGVATDFCNGDATHYFCQPLDPLLDQVAFYCGNSNDKTHQIGLKSPNAYGIHDMHGNVAEWCWDYYSDYGMAALTNPRGPSFGLERIIRGGGYDDLAQTCRSSFRFAFHPDGYLKKWGFRVARNKTD